MTAGYAAADVALSGSAEMGINGGSDINTQFFTDIDVTFTMSGTTDNGLSFGASIDLDESDEDGADNGFNPTGARAFDPKSQGGETIFISGDFGRITMGDTDGAFDYAMTEVLFGSGSIGDNEEHGGYNGNGGLDGTYDGQILSYTYSVAGFGFAVSLELDDDPATGNDDPVLGLGVRYAGEMNGMSYGVGLGYQTVETAAGIETNVLGVSGNVEVAGFELGINASRTEEDLEALDIEHIGVGVGYSMDAWSFGVNYGEYDNLEHTAGQTESGVGATVGYDLGGGAALKLGYGSSEDADGVDSDTWSFGVAMSF